MIKPVFAQPTRNLLLLSLALGAVLPAARGNAAEYLWLEAEHSTDVKDGYYFSNEVDAKLEDKRGWSISGPGIAAEWTQGGESEWTSVATHAGETAATLRYKIEVPVAGRYRVWARYADYANAKEEFRVRIVQGDKTKYGFDHVFGSQDIIDAGDEIKLMWGWAFGWDSAEGDLQAGSAEVQVMADAPTQARRQFDALLVTTDMQFRPQLRDKPPFHYWAPLEANRLAMQQKPATPPAGDFAVPAGWRTPLMAGREFSMLFNMQNDFWKQDKIAPEKRVKYPFWIGHGEPITKAFIRDWGGKSDIPVWSSKFNCPIFYFQSLEEFFLDDSPALKWLRETKTPFGILLNYAKYPPSDSFGDKSAMIAKNLASLKSQFLGYMSGENIGYVHDVNYNKDLYPDLAKMKPGIEGRQQMLDRIGAIHTPAFQRKFGKAYGIAPGTTMPTDSSPNPWETMVSALSTDMMPHTHAFAEWGERTLGHEATANDSMLALRWAFLRGAARQFGRNWVYYLSSNFGDTATTMVGGGNYAGPFANYYHSHYDAFSGTGLPWYRKAYFSTYMAGVAGIYLEQGFDQYYIPSPGPDTVRVSPLGNVTDEFVRFAAKHPDRGVPYTPVAFLLDRGHMWYSSENQAGANSSPPQYNPAILGYSRHDAMIRDVFNIAYYPVPKIEAGPVESPHYSFINSPLGDTFDVLVTSKSPKAPAALANYRAVVLAGDVVVDAAWGKALRDFVQKGGTAVVTDDQMQGPGAGALGLPTGGPGGAGQYGTANSVVWITGPTPKGTKAPVGETLACNTFRYRRNAPKGQVLAATADGQPVAVLLKQGKGRVIWIGIPKGLGLDDRATPVLAKAIILARAGLMPVEVSGDVEYSVNRNKAGWVVTLMNNRGYYKPQHGLGVPRREETTTVTLRTVQPVGSATEWTEEQPLAVQKDGAARTVTLEVPAGGVRIIQLAP